MGNVVRFVLILVFVPVSHASGAPERQSINVAVASNFSAAFENLATAFEADYGYTVQAISASSGKLYAQISNGAPFDIFLSADRERPLRLETAGLGVTNQRFTYAIGRLVLWSRDPGLANRDCEQVLKNLSFNRLAIANPVIAPYGDASRQFLENIGLWAAVSERLVVGENITQALQFTASGGASLGLVAASQLVDSRLPETTCRWSVPTNMYEPIEQQAVLLSRAAENRVAADFIEFLQSGVAREVIQRHGYAVTGPDL